MATADASATVHLIDASPYIFRAFFVMPSSLTDPEGQPVGAVHGFASFLLKLLREEEPTHLAAAFDGSLTTSFRNDLFPPYKAQRELPPAELEAQLDRCQKIAEALGVKTWIDNRYEADDILGTLCRGFVDAGHRVVILSSDKDLAQLVGERVELWDYARDTRFGPEEVHRKLGVAPEQVADFLGLAGDSVDNIPGVQGVGAKTAARLLDAFGTLEALYTRLDEVEELPLRGAASLRRKLAEQQDMAELSRRLATVVTDAPLSATLEDVAWKGAQRQPLEELCAELGFERLPSRVPRWR